MRALNVFRLLSLAIVLVNGEASSSVKPEEKKLSKNERELQYYYDFGYYMGGYDYITAEPTPRPTHKPSPYPSPRPTPHPTGKPSPMPTHYPSPRPTPHPTPQPSRRPTKRPTAAPIPHPTKAPTPNPTPDPTPRPTIHPTPNPTTHPTCAPSPTPSARPTPNPTAFPTTRPSSRPTFTPTSKPTQSSEPSENPTMSEEPSENPTMSEEPSENPTMSEEPTTAAVNSRAITTFTPTSISTLEGSSTMSSALGCGGGESILDVVCAARNRNVLGSLCDEVRNRNLEDLLGDCNQRLTLFAPTNGAFEIFFDRFNDVFFEDPNNFSFNPIGDIVIGDEMTVGIVSRHAGNIAETIERIPLLDDRGGRKLIDVEFKNEFLFALLNYHIVSRPLKEFDLKCEGNDRNIRMRQRGFSATVCTDFDRPEAQEGTCNVHEAMFHQTDIPTANGIIHVVTQVLIPSPTGDVSGCTLIGP